MWSRMFALVILLTAEEAFFISEPGFIDTHTLVAQHRNIEETAAKSVELNETDVIGGEEVCRRIVYRDPLSFELIDHFGCNAPKVELNRLCDDNLTTEGVCKAIDRALKCERHQRDACREEYITIDITTIKLDVCCCGKNGCLELFERNTEYADRQRAILQNGIHSYLYQKKYAEVAWEKYALFGLTISVAIACFILIFHKSSQAIKSLQGFASPSSGETMLSDAMNMRTILNSEVPKEEEMLSAAVSEDMDTATSDVEEEKEHFEMTLNELDD